jgi:hypothetical protein
VIQWTLFAGRCSLANYNLINGLHARYSKKYFSIEADKSEERKNESKKTRLLTASAAFPRYRFNALRCDIFLYAC